MYAKPDGVFFGVGKLPIIIEVFCSGTTHLQANNDGK